MAAVETAAEKVREQRKPVAADNPFVAFQEKISEADRRCARQLARLAGGAQRGDVPCRLRLAGAAGRGRHRSAVGRRRAKPEMSPEHRELSGGAHRGAEIAESANGGLQGSVVRGLLYVGMARGMVDERSLEALRRRSRGTTRARG